MRVYTQSNVNHTMPDRAIWLPCITTEPVEHVAAVAQPLLITHIAALQHYQHPITELLCQQILCVGRHTAERLRGWGFEKIHCYLRAEEIEILQPTTWLRGDHYMHRELADQRFLSAASVAKVSEAVRELLNQWAEDGWLHPLA